MRHDLASPAHADEARAELVFQATVDTFDHGAQGEALLFPISMRYGQGRRDQSQPKQDRQPLRVPFAMGRFASRGS